MSEPCETCGQPAVCSIQDMQEIEPVKDRDGRLWMQWELVGLVRYFCAEHERKPVLHAKRGK